MYCPKCKAKYIDEQLICSDCDVSLVPELSPHQQPEFTNFSRLHSPSSSSELITIKNILSKADINYYTTNDKHSPDMELNKGCIVMVQDGHFEKARKILSDSRIKIRPPKNSLMNKRSKFDDPGRTIKDRVFGWAPIKKDRSGDPRKK